MFQAPVSLERESMVGKDLLLIPTPVIFFGRALTTTNTYLMPSGLGRAYVQLPSHTLLHVNPKYRRNY